MKKLLLLFLIVISASSEEILETFGDTVDVESFSNVTFTTNRPTEYASNPVYSDANFLVGYNVLFYDSTYGDSAFTMIYQGQELAGIDTYVVAAAISSDGINWTPRTVGTVNYRGSTDNNLIDIGNGVQTSVSAIIYKDGYYYLQSSVGLDADGVNVVNADTVWRSTQLWDGWEFYKSFTVYPSVSGEPVHGMYLALGPDGYMIDYQQGWQTPNRNIMANHNTDTGWVDDGVIINRGTSQAHSISVNKFGKVYYAITDGYRDIPLRAGPQSIYVSRDGLDWELKDSLWIENGSSGEWDHTLQLRPSNFVTVGDTVHQFYISGSATGDSTRTHGMGLFTIKKDRIFTATADNSSSTVTTKAFANTGKLRINYTATGAGDSIRVEVLNFNDAAITGYSVDSCIVMTGDSLSKEVKWGTKSLSDCDTNLIKLKFYLYSNTDDVELHAYEIDETRAQFATPPSNTEHETTIFTKTTYISEAEHLYQVNLADYVSMSTIDSLISSDSGIIVTSIYDTVKLKSTAEYDSGRACILHFLAPSSSINKFQYKVYLGEYLSHVNDAETFNDIGIENYLSFTSISGTDYIDLAGSNDGSIEGNTDTITSVFDLGADFSSAGDYVNVGQLSALQSTDSFTIQIIGNFDDAVTAAIGQFLFKCQVSSTNRININTYDGWIYATIGNGFTNYARYDFDGVIGDGEDHIYTVRYNGNGATNADKLQFFVDDSEKPLTFTGTMPATTGSLAGDCSVSDVTEPTIGSIDEFTVYSTYISDDAVKIRYNTLFVGDIDSMSTIREVAYDASVSRPDTIKINSFDYICEVSPASNWSIRIVKEVGDTIGTTITSQSADGFLGIVPEESLVFRRRPYTLLFERGQYQVVHRLWLSGSSRGSSIGINIGVGF